MKPLRWSADKSDWLKRERGVSFEELTLSPMVDLLQHPSRPHQRILLFAYEHYLWAVPYVETEAEWFLKTAYRSRKFTAIYRRKGLLL